MVDKIRKGWRIISWRSACLLSALLLHAWAFSSPLAKNEHSAAAYQHRTTAISLSFVAPSVAQPAVAQKPQKTNEQPAAAKPPEPPKIVKAAQKKPPRKKPEPPLIVQKDTPAKAEQRQSETSSPKVVRAKKPHKPPKQQTLAAMPSAPQQMKSTGVHSNPVINKPLFKQPPTPPKYPTVARKRGQQGTVWLEIWLDQWGKQSKLSVMQSSGIQVLDKAALKAVSNWHFQPHRVNGQGIASRVRIPVQFALN